MKKIVILVDPPRKVEYVDLARHDMEGYTPLEVELTLKAIRSFTSASLYTSVEKFMRRLWFHKHDLIFPMVWGRGERNTKSILQVQKIGAGPYYLVEQKPRFATTMGGLVVNKDLQVQDTNGQTIAGLYASGEVVGGVMGDDSPSGANNGWAVTSGKLAMESIAAEIQQVLAPAA